jgi:hypothetical protein
MRQPNSRPAEWEIRRAAHDRLWERVRDRFGCAVVPVLSGDCGRIGETVETVAAEYQLSPDQIKAALAYAAHVAAHLPPAVRQAS